MTGAVTLPGVAFANAAHMAERPAMREKLYGIWRTWTWRDYASEVKDFALGLATLGFKAGDKLAVIGDNRPPLYWAELAAQALGGMAVPLYQDSIAEELAYVLAHAEASVVVAENQEQVDKILSIRDRLPALRWLVYSNARGMTGYDDPSIKSFKAVQEEGRRFGATHPGLVEDSIARLDTDGVALICYTSGTTGRPKGVMLSHANLLSVARNFTAVEPVGPDDDFLSYLPMAWIGEATYGLAVSLTTGARCNCPEDPATLRRDLSELGPTGFIAAPRVWETILSDIQVRAEDLGGLKRLVFNCFRDAAVARTARASDGKPVTLIDHIMRALGEVLVYGPVRDQYGLRRARWCYVGGAPLGRDTFLFFRAFGVNLKQLYGSTEVAGLVSVQRDGEAGPDTVGPPVPGIDVRIGENGEVQVRSGGVFKGYFKDEAATRAALTPDGWFRTGDAGRIDAKGHITIIDRAKDVGHLTDGTVYAPQFIENKLKFSPYIAEAVSFGDGKPFVTAMVAIDTGAVGKWAERQRVPYTNYMDLSQKPEVRRLIGEEIGRINRTLPDALKVRRFLLLAKDLEADDAEITRTRKLRRNLIQERYAPVINVFYSGGSEVDLRAEVTFEDGRRSHVDMRLAVQDAA